MEPNNKVLCQKNLVEPISEDLKVGQPENWRISNFRFFNLDQNLRHKIEGISQSWAIFAKCMLL